MYVKIPSSIYPLVLIFSYSYEYWIKGRMKNYFLLVKIIHYMAGKFDGDDVDAVTGSKRLLRLGDYRLNTPWLSWVSRAFAGGWRIAISFVVTAYKFLIRRLSAADPILNIMNFYWAIVTKSMKRVAVRSLKSACPLLVSFHSTRKPSWDPTESFKILLGLIYPSILLGRVHRGQFGYWVLYIPN